MPPKTCCAFSFSCKKTLLAITINNSDINVTNVVNVVEMLANLGTFKKLLFSKIKLILEKIASAIANINFQLNNSFKIESILNKFPEIKFLSPNKTIEKAVLRQ